MLPTAPVEVIKAAIKAQLRIWHPDINPSPEATEHLVLINLAAEVLLDPNARASYDAGRSQSGRLTEPTMTFAAPPSAAAAPDGPAASASNPPYASAASAPSDSPWAPRKPVRLDSEPAGPRYRPSVPSRRRPWAAIVLFVKQVGVSAVVWILTPVVASFGTFVMPNLMTAVFVPSENNGRSAGDGPITLYIHLAWLLGGLAVFVLLANLVFGLGLSFTWIPVLAGFGGVVAFFWQVISNGGALWMWDIAPAAIAAGYLLAQIFTSLAARIRAR